MTDDPQRERIAQLLAELADLPYGDREAFLASLPEHEREAVWAAELEAGDEALPEDYEDLGAGE
jgi:hypothetical protein